MTPKELTALKLRLYDAIVRDPDLWALDLRIAWVLLSKYLNSESLVAEPMIAPLNGLECRKVVGTLFTSQGGQFIATEDEVAAVDAPADYFRFLDQARLFKVQGAARNLWPWTVST